MHDSNPNSEVGGESADSMFWYIMDGAKQHGPIFFSRLRQMAHQGKLSHDNMVRKGTTGEWVLAGDLKDVLFPSPAELESMAATEAFAEHQPEPKVKEPGVLANLFSSMRDRIEVFYEGVIQGCVDRLNVIRVITSWIAFVGVSVALSVVLSNQFSVDWFIRTDPLATYSSIWDELKGKRQAKATPAEWDAFTDKARREITPIVARLERTASSNDRYSQQLLWAGRDYLLKMLDDAREDVSLSEKHFEVELQRAIWLKEGKDLGGRGPFYRGPSASSGIMSDTTTTILGIVFVILDVGIVFWFFAGRRKPKNAA